MDTAGAGVALTGTAGFFAVARRGAGLAAVRVARGLDGAAAGSDGAGGGTEAGAAAFGVAAFFFAGGFVGSAGVFGSVRFLAGILLSSSWANG